MTTTIRHSCPACREDIIIPAGRVWATICGFTRTWGYRCPACNQFITNAGDTDTFSRLAQAGIRARSIRPPEPAEHAAFTGPALTEDDLITFGLALHTPADAAT